MKKFYITFIALFFIHLLHAQNPLAKQWDNRFGGNLKEFMNSFHQTSDGGYILGGYSDSPVSRDNLKQATLSIKNILGQTVYGEKENKLFKT